MTLSVSGPPSLPPIITNSVLKSPRTPTVIEETKNKNEDKDPKRCPTPVTVTFFGQNDGKLEICQVEDEKVNLNPFASFLNDPNPFQPINPFSSTNPFCESDHGNKGDATETEDKESGDEVNIYSNFFCFEHFLFIKLCSNKCTHQFCSMASASSSNSVLFTPSVPNCSHAKFDHNCCCI